MEETKNKAAPVIRLQDVRKEYVVGDSHIHALDGVPSWQATLRR